MEYLRIKTEKLNIINNIDNNYRKLESINEYRKNTYNRVYNLITKYSLPKKQNTLIKNKNYRLLIKDKECTSRFKNYGNFYYLINIYDVEIISETECYYITQFRKIKKSSIMGIVEN